MFNLSCKVSYLIFFLGFLICCNSSETNIQIEHPTQVDIVYPSDIMYFSQDFFLAVRSEDPLQNYLDTLSRIDLDRLVKDLDTYEIKLTFWINIYNSLVQVKLKQDESAFNKQTYFFSSKDLNIGGRALSLDNIEHGILRGKSTSENEEFVNKFRLQKQDHRIHFTMNCGATSCPTIAYYSPENIENELQNAENLFIKMNTIYDPENNIVETSRIFKWFNKDFGGDLGIIELFKKHEIIPENVNPIISYKPYNWELKSKNYN